MSLPPALSVIMPVYNAARSIPDAVDSILQQTETSCELIVIDDGSDDGTPAYLRSLRDPRVRVIRIRRSGIAAALNAGLARARGRFIARMDADDFSYPERLTQQLRYLRQHPAIGLVGCQAEFGGDSRARAGYARYLSWTNSLTAPGQIALARFIESPFIHPTIMFRRSLLRKFGGYRDGPFPEDYELILRWMARGVRMAKVPEVLLRWNDHQGRLSRTDRRYSVDAFFRLKAGYLAEWLRDRNPRHPDVVIWGAGRITRRRAAALGEHGIRCCGYIDIDPKKTRTPLNGIPRYYYKDIPPAGELFVLSYVGVRDAREFIGSFLKQRGYIEGRHFLHCA